MSSSLSEAGADTGAEAGAETGAEGPLIKKTGMTELINVVVVNLAIFRRWAEAQPV